MNLENLRKEQKLFLINVLTSLTVLAISIIPSLRALNLPFALLLLIIIPGICLHWIVASDFFYRNLFTKIFFILSGGISWGLLCSLLLLVINNFTPVSIIVVSFLSNSALLLVVAIREKENQDPSKIGTELNF